MKSTVLNSRGFNASIITMGTTVEVGNLDISDSSGIITGYIGDPITPFEISTLEISPFFKLLSQVTLR